MEKSLLTILEESFERVKVKGDYAVIKSPFNPDDKNPSCVVALTDTDKFSEGFFKDFSTGRSGNIYSLLKIKRNFGFGKKQVKLPQLSSITEVKTHWSSMEYAPSEYLNRRGISYEVQEQFRCFEIDGMVSMPVFDRDGYLIYTVSRTTTGKHYANSGETEAYPAFTHTLNNSDTVFVVESMIDAYSLFTVGLKAISLNSAGNHSMLKDVFKFHFGKIVLALDPDLVGQENAALIMDELSGKDVTNIVLPKDVNDCWSGILHETKSFDVAKTVFLKLLERKINNKIHPCMDCGKETKDTDDEYLVRDDVWSSAVPEENHFGVYFLCKKCLSARLGRPLEKSDFIVDN